MKILRLTLKKKWFDMILSGEKIEEYREIKNYWLKRLIDKHLFIDTISFKHWLDNLPDNLTLQHVVNHFDAIRFTNGYSKNSPSFTIECKGIEIGNGLIEWGADPSQEYFIIKLGKLI